LQIVGGALLALGATVIWRRCLLPICRHNGRVEFLINLKAAKALGLTMPKSFLVRADDVIE
jgi:hypothetical protein